MTAEVAVLNRSGAALAADSAVTLGRADKIYTSAEKLFQMAAAAPVGVMIYGNAHFLGLPWETIIKLYRRNIGGRTFERLDDYAQNFLGFIRTDRSVFPSDRQDHHSLSLVSTLLEAVRQQIRIDLSRRARVADGLSAADLPPAIDEIISARLSEVVGAPEIEGFSKARRLRLQRRLKAAVDERISSIFGLLPVSARSRRNLVRIAFEMLARQYLGPAHSGVVVAGFGEKDLMPRLVSYELEEMIEDCPRITVRQGVEIDDENTCSVVPFAQQEMVYAFMEGINSSLLDYIEKSTTELFAGSIDAVLAAVGKQDKTMETRLRGPIAGARDQLLRKLFDAWRHGRSDHWGPVLEAVAAMPKDELAAMAESLVNLTRLRRKVTSVPETVGGPIDVAVITKGDGFVWVKRKHYFQAELNPRAIARYTRGEQ